MLNVGKREVLNSHYGARSMHSGKVILIVGGTGQVGTAAAAALLRRGWKEIDV
jgi:FlaA1/EpsC-like NDP-sugar epimerase